MRVDLPIVMTRHTLFSRSEELSEGQLKSLCQSLEASLLVPCGSDDKEFVILTPEIKFDSLNTCDSQSAYEVFNLSVLKHSVYTKTSQTGRAHCYLLGMKVLSIRTILMMQFSLEINWQVAFTTKTVTCYLVLVTVIIATMLMQKVIITLSKAGQ